MGQMKNAFHKYVVVREQSQALMRKELCELDHRDWDPTSLVNTCPACFNFGEGDKLRDINISLDGNMQHKRFKTKVSHDQEILPTSRIVVSPERRIYKLRKSNTGKDVPADLVESTSCGNRYKATFDWKKTEKSIASKKMIDESGLMGTTCNHGICLRILSFYQSGERYSHLEALINNIMEECNPHNVRVCYDVGCVAEATLLDERPDWTNKLRMRIGRFHLYAHKFKCHVLKSPLRTIGYGLMVGEEVEHLWYQLRHLVSSGRISTGPRRIQAIDTTIRHLGEKYREQMGKNLSTRWRAMNENTEKSLATLSDLYQKKRPSFGNTAANDQFYNKEYLIEQARLQKAHYMNYRQPVADERDYEIYLSLAIEEKLENASSDIQMQRAVKNTNNLLNKIRVNRESFSRTSTRYLNAKKGANIKKLVELQKKIIDTCTDRVAEAELLHRRLKGNKAAQKCVTALNSRWKQLKSLVDTYNKIIDEARIEIQKLSVEDIRKDGTQCDQLWAIDRLVVRDDWAKSLDIRRGIDALHRLERSKEEERMLRLHLKRMLDWLKKDCRTLLMAAHELTNSSSNKHSFKTYIASLLVQRVKIIRNILKIKTTEDRLFTPTQRQKLLGRLEEIQRVLIEAETVPFEVELAMTDLALREPEPTNVDEDYDTMDDSDCSYEDIQKEYIAKLVVKTLDKIEIEQEERVETATDNLENDEDNNDGN